ncbi:cAMP-specific 3'%2C5'-cyclic phosphodiesterase 4D-like isoform X3 [Xyrichtys novacula]|uniref:cAMP-specific 3',5'-cyclic phosphodiesterase 4D-like isoform X3 n=1 Tax=Xyrichtys novacula TaxID=13765 RepID=A0AAV1FIN9_XYRNO|nr:cAMP-specific 3'%2C5'-cyclic phosphodiesterase 4D-like isoform X3 [Xyrichtys novacula]
MSRLEGRRESLPALHHVVRRRFSGPVLLPPLRRRHSVQEHHHETRRASAAHGLPLDRLEVLYSRALASHDEYRSVHTHVLLFFFPLPSFFFSAAYMFEALTSLQM